jgi:hypothetical protein
MTNRSLLLSVLFAMLVAACSAEGSDRHARTVDYGFGDAGPEVDLGAVDAGDVDAGPGDSDAGFGDAGPVDTDAGTDVDAGTDAGETDAGTDAGAMGDAGPDLSLDPGYTPPPASNTVCTAYGPSTPPCLATETCRPYNRDEFRCEAADRFGSPGQPPGPSGFCNSASLLVLVRGVQRCQKMCDYTGSGSLCGDVLCLPMWFGETSGIGHCND